jgi:hypothetical protein
MPPKAGKGAGKGKGTGMVAGKGVAGKGKIALGKGAGKGTAGKGKGKGAPPPRGSLSSLFDVLDARRNAGGAAKPAANPSTAKRATAAVANQKDKRKEKVAAKREARPKVRGARHRLSEHLRQAGFALLHSDAFA